MRKILALIFIVVILCTSLCACACSENDTSSASMFVTIEETYSFRIVYHKTTKIMYAISCGAYNGGDFTLLVNADGSPMIYEEAK